MTKLVALSPARHKHLRIDPERLEAQGARERIIPVVISEFQKLVVQYPIAFTKSEESGEFVCVAMLGFEENENLYWTGSRWEGIYTPLHVMRQPFFIGNDQGNNIVCIDEEGASLSDIKGDAIFDEDGKETVFLQDVKKMLTQLMEADRETKEFVTLLVEYDLLVPMHLDITFANSEQQKVRGFYTLDQKKLDSLDAEKLIFLQEKRYLTPLHMIIASTGHIYSLVDKKNKKLARA